MVDDVDEVCPLRDGRLVLFGGTYNSANINILSLRDASLLDSFYGFDPTMSPNQRWLVYREFYPRHTDFAPSEEYLLYDLTKTPAQNRPPGAALYDRAEVGTAVFPLVGSGNLPFDSSWLPEDQQHQARSHSFFWSPDSQAIGFGDSVQGKRSIVLVRLDESGKTTASVRPVPRAEVCDHESTAGQPVTLYVDGPIVLSGQGGDLLVRVTLSSTDGICPPKTMELHSSDFQPAIPEVHVQPKRKGVIIDPVGR